MTEWSAQQGLNARKSDINKFRGTLGFVGVHKFVDGPVNWFWSTNDEQWGVCVVWSYQVQADVAGIKTRLWESQFSQHRSLLKFKLVNWREVDTWLLLTLPVLVETSWERLVISGVALDARKPTADWQASFRYK
jgi:predicted NUDIX family NTP pyrophosphohydrolase